MRNNIEELHYPTDPSGSNGDSGKYVKGEHVNEHPSNRWKDGEKAPSGRGSFKRESRSHFAFEAMMRQRPLNGADRNAAANAEDYYNAIHGEPEEY